MQRHSTLLIGTLALLALCLQAAPRSAAAAGEREIFIQRCGSCHGKGRKAPAVNPADFAAVQWKNFFKRHKHRRIEDISGLLSPDEAAAVLRYLQRHAADSDQPEVAAIP